MAILTVMAPMVDMPGGKKWPPFEIVHRHRRVFFVFFSIAIFEPYQAVKFPNGFFNKHSG